jgi:hypothetical protein
MNSLTQLIKRLLEMEAKAVAASVSCSHNHIPLRFSKTRQDGSYPKSWTASGAIGTGKPCTPGTVTLFIRQTGSKNYSRLTFASTVNFLPKEGISKRLSV